MLLLLFCHVQMWPKVKNNSMLLFFTYDLSMYADPPTQIFLQEIKGRRQTFSVVWGKFNIFLWCPPTSLPENIYLYLYVAVSLKLVNKVVTVVWWGPAPRKNPLWWYFHVFSQPKWNSGSHVTNIQAKLSQSSVTGWGGDHKHCSHSRSPFGMLLESWLHEYKIRFSF